MIQEGQTFLKVNFLLVVNFSVELCWIRDAGCLLLNYPSDSDDIWPSLCDFSCISSDSYPGDWAV